MSNSKDLHICGECKKIFSELDLFPKHKSQCSLLLNDAGSPKTTQDISVDNILFPEQPMLDLTELGNENFQFILHYDNEEIVTDDHVQYVRKNHSPVEQLTRLLESDNVGLCRPSTSNESDFSEEDVVSFLVNQLCKEVVNKDESLVKIARKPEETKKNFSNSGPLITKEDSHLENARLKNTTDKRKNVCTICNYSAAYRRDLIRHIRKHSGERPYPCCYCNKTFARQDKLVEHKRIHLGDKKFKCHLCSYASTDSGPLRKHLLIHTDLRPYKCQVCSYRARHASHLTVHIRTHTGDTPFFCQVEACGRVFKTGTDLNRHMKVHKRRRLSPSYSSFDDELEKLSCKHLKNVRFLNKTTTCHVCQAFSQKDELEKLSCKHLKNVRFLNKTTTCHVCQAFSQKGEGSQRSRGRGRGGGRRVRCSKSHQCPYCTAAFVRADSLRSHVRQHRSNTPEHDHNDKQEQEHSSPRHQLSDVVVQIESTAEKSCLDGF